MWEALDALWLQNATGLMVETVEETDSTNLQVRNWGKENRPEGCLLLADRQTQGRGRLGRQFHSPAGTGLYMSLLLRPFLPPEDALLITTAAAVAVVQGIADCTGKSAGIKWVNDVLMEGKKVCGILTESALTPEGALHYAVLGMGINCHPPEGGFPEEIREIAGTVFDSENGNRNELAAAVINRFMALYRKLPDRHFMEDYRRLNVIPGKDIWVIRPNEKYPARALSLDDRAGLLVRREGGREELLRTSEISVRNR